MALEAFDEMNGLPSKGAPVREVYDTLKAWLDQTPREHFNTRRSQAELLFGASGSPSRSMGRTSRRSG